MRTKWKRLASIICLGCVICLGIVFYIQFFLTRPIGSGPAGPAVDLEPFRSAWTVQKVHLLGIGDSITAGLGAKSAEHTFFNRLRLNPADEYADMKGRCLAQVLPKLTCENLAVSGSTSQEHLDVLLARLKVQDSDVYGIVVMTTGGNDLIHSYGRRPPQECAMYGATLEQADPWMTSFRQRLDEILALIENAFPGGCEVHLADIYDPTDGVGDAPSIYLPHWRDGLAIHAKYNAAIRDSARRRSNVYIVPLHETFLGHGSHCRQFWRSHYNKADPHYWFFSNIEDPNDRGYDAIRRVFLNSILINCPLRGGAKDKVAVIDDFND